MRPMAEKISALRTLCQLMAVSSSILLFLFVGANEGAGAMRRSAGAAGSGVTRSEQFLALILQVDERAEDQQAKRCVDRGDSHVLGPFGGSGASDEAVDRVRH